MKFETARIRVFIRRFRSRSLPILANIYGRQFFINISSQGSEFRSPCLRELLKIILNQQGSELRSPWLTSTCPCDCLNQRVKSVFRSLLRNKTNSLNCAVQYLILLARRAKLIEDIIRVNFLICPTWFSLSYPIKLTVSLLVIARKEVIGY